MHPHYSFGKVLVHSLGVSVAFLVLTSITHGADYQPLVGIPELAGGGTGLAAYFNKLYVITIAVGAILAFLKISIAGVKWSLSEIITEKSDAKNDIKGALLGLAILLVPFIVLNTIYGGLTSLNILQNADSVRVDLNASSRPAPSTPVVTQGETTNNLSPIQLREMCEKGPNGQPTGNVYNLEQRTCTSPGTTPTPNGSVAPFLTVPLSEAQGYSSGRFAEIKSQCPAGTRFSEDVQGDNMLFYCNPN